MADQQEEIPILNEVVEKETTGNLVGQVKWFGDNLGYGFITINDGPEKGKDIFVHHSGIKPANSNYKTLRKGEYVNFNVIKGANGLQAIDITGINGGPLMCDIIMGFRKIGEIYPYQQPPPPPPRDQNQPGWKTVPRKTFGPKKPIKNFNKYNKATRNVAPTSTPAESA